METRKVFDETIKIDKEVTKTKKYLNMLNNKTNMLKEECSHEIVFKYNDNHPRKMIIDGNYFCPACGKTIRCIHNNDIKESRFKKSRIIPLSNISLLGTKEVYYLIRKEVFENMNYYYNKNIDIEDLSNRMENILIDFQYDYNKGFRI